jgi:hypothetical protein
MWLALALAAVLLALAFAQDEATRPSAAQPSGAAGPGLGARSDLAGLAGAPLAAASQAMGARDRAFHVRVSGAGYVAVNRPQRLAVRFDLRGVTLRSGSLRVSVGQPALGANEGARVARGAPKASLNLVTYAYAGVRESYANGPLGLEQSFVLASAPSGGRAGSLTLAMKLAGNGRARVTAGGRGVMLSHGGSSLAYGGLLATDARGRALPASLGLRAGNLFVRVDTRDARYPVRIDPLVQQGAKLTGGEQESGLAEFGFSVAISSDGNTALVGAPHNNPLAGAAWSFVRQGGAWVELGAPLNSGQKEPQKEQCEPEVAEESGNCGFGSSVALSADGKTALIGSPIAREPCPGSSEPCADQGAAWVYTRSGGSTWTQQGPTLTGGEEETASGHFGRSVALSADGNTALVDAPADRVHRGSVWAFERKGSTWVQQGEKLTPAEMAGEGYFGVALALSADGNTALMGAPGDAGFRGAAWVFERSHSVWTQKGGKHTGAEEIGESHFGRSVALSASGSVALVGGYGDNGRIGAAWAFERSGSAWAPQGGKITGPEEIGQANFGRSVALSSDGAKALIGGPHDAAKRGAAWTFTRTGTTWSQSGKKLKARDGKAKSWFGHAVALSGTGDTALIGGPKDAGELGAAWSFAEGVELEEPEPPPEEEPPHKKPKDPPPGPPTESPQTGGLTPAQLGLGGGRVLPFGPIASAASCKPSLLGRNIAVNRKGRTTLKFLLLGSGSCRSKLTLTVKQKRPHGHPRTRTIATGTFSLTAGRVTVLTLKLNALGRALLHAGHGRLGASLAIMRLSPGPVQAHTASVRLTLRLTHARPTKH